MKKFAVGGGGFQMSFDSGYTVSVAFNGLAKCRGLETTTANAACQLAEVLVWRTSDDSNVLFDGGTEEQPCHGRRTPEQVADILKRAADNNLFGDNPKGD